jgi:RsmE family RNA methyltransferase
VNSLIIFPNECITPQQIVLRGERAVAVSREYEAREGQEITIALWGGNKGAARLCSVAKHEVTMEITRQEPSTPLLPFDLVIGLSRPQTIKKVIQAAVMTGVRSLHLVSTELGEKSYTTATLLEPEHLRNETVKALEQIGEGYSPTIHVHRSFSYFCRTHLESLVQGNDTVRLLAHPNAREFTIVDRLYTDRPIVVAVGPESGWSQREVAEFEARGFERVGLGPRVMRVEIALVFLLGQLRVLSVGS